MKRELLLLLFLAGCIFASRAVSGETPQATYVIKRGDTLWGLSERFLNDPYCWPGVWSDNPVITNPHLIYEGQKIIIFPDRIEVAPESKPPLKPETRMAKEESNQDIPAAEERSFVINGTESFLELDETRPFGSIIGIYGDRMIAGEDDIVFTDMGRAQNLKGGEKFLVYSAESSVSHPVTNEIMGRKIIPLGMLQITNVEKRSSRAIIIRNFKEIVPGAYLMPYRDDRRHEVTLKLPKRDIKGYLIESQSGANIIASGDIVHTDIGEAEGGEQGNLLYIVRDVTIDQRYSEGRINRLPQELLGALVILETRKKSSMALVVKSIDAIYIGDRIVARVK